ncbi:hypothetical protein FLAG1_10208 [Fusarium langsethiae]|uniref:Uncharacterized protein n=1 Tax=Fusarium langsethiae TaxID=179993 RepID=A0A0M9EPK9_FUSLA|nr:hypothetical protein FLAG1_10208 [Fusarium langsethiae]GKU14079.1 unnamed protein product [Fusarium langsethiae]GKU15258.1 unnamed protein product [Fusarium langsethiae]
MGGNKNRLYIALYPSGVVNNEERRYHWGFLIGPKSEKGAEIPGMRYHVKNHPIHSWIYEEIPLSNVRSTNNLLARVVIAKIEDEGRLVELIRNTPVVQNDPNWRCRTWVAQALSRIAQDGMATGTAELDWKKIEAVAREYVASKTAAGRYLDAADMALPKPTYDMLQGKEVVP